MTKSTDEGLFNGRTERNMKVNEKKANSMALGRLHPVWGSVGKDIEKTAKESIGKMKRFSKYNIKYYFKISKPASLFSFSLFVLRSQNFRLCDLLRQPVSEAFFLLYLSDSLKCCVLEHHPVRNDVKKLKHVFGSCKNLSKSLLGNGHFKGVCSNVNVFGTVLKLHELCIGLGIGFGSPSANHQLGVDLFLPDLPLFVLILQRLFWSEAVDIEHLRLDCHAGSQPQDIQI